VSTYNRVVAADSTASLAPTVRARLATEMADPASTVGASLSEAFGRALPEYRGLAQLAEGLKRGDGTSILVLGDSTGNDTTEWPYRLGEWIGSQYPSYTVEWRSAQDETPLKYAPPTVIQTGTAGASSVTIDSTGGGAHQYVATSVFSGDDVDIAVKVSLPDWTPAANTALINQLWSAGFRAFTLYMQTSGLLRYTPYEDGTNVSAGGSFSATAAPTVTDGAVLWIRFTLDANDGAGNALGKFYTGVESGSSITWTQLGTTVTQASTTTTNRPDSVPYRLGVANGAMAATGATFYEATIRNGIDGEVLADPVTSRWIVYATSATINGAPVVTIWNGSLSGRNAAYLSDASRFKLLTPQVSRMSTVFISDGHNESNRTGPTWISTISTFIALIEGRYPQASITVCVQNPQVLPASQWLEHDVRMQELRSWLEGIPTLGMVDVYSVFVATGTPSTYLNVDGVHPTSGTPGSDGQSLWLNAITGPLANLTT